LDFFDSQSLSTRSEIDSKTLLAMSRLTFPSQGQFSMLSQQPTIAVEHHCRDRARRVQIEWPEARAPADRRERHAEPQHRRDTGRDEKAGLARRSAHFSLTSNVPAAVRPKRLGRYMSSMLAGGCT
jgi:hypothetical protein